MYQSKSESLRRRINTVWFLHLYSHPNRFLILFFPFFFKYFFRKSHSTISLFDLRTRVRKHMLIPLKGNERLPVEIGWVPRDVEITNDIISPIIQELISTSPPDVPLTFDPASAWGDVFNILLFSFYSLLFLCVLKFELHGQLHGRGFGDVE